MIQTFRAVESYKRVHHAEVGSWSPVSFRSTYHWKSR